MKIDLVCRNNCLDNNRRKRRNINKSEANVPLSRSAVWKNTECQMMIESTESGQWCSNVGAHFEDAAAAALLPDAGARDCTQAAC